MTVSPKLLSAARESALAVFSPALASLVVTGGDRLTWLNGLLTCDLAPRRPGDIVYGLAVTQKGRVLADVTVVIRENDVILLTPVAHCDELRASCERYLVMEDAEMAPGAYDVTLVHGPRAAELLAATTAVGATVGAFDWTGLGGGVILAPHAARDAVERAIDAALTAVGGARGDDATWEALRIEQAVPALGPDFGASTYPQEAGLERAAVSFTKGCYVGQEVVYMLEKRGQVKRKLVLLELDGAATPTRGAQLHDAAGAHVGEVTSAVMSPTHARPLALAMLKRALAVPGQELTVEGAAARVVKAV